MALTQYEIQQIITALKAQSLDVATLASATVVTDGTTLPAHKDDQLVSLNVQLLKRYITTGLNLAELDDVVEFYDYDMDGEQATVNPSAPAPGSYKIIYRDISGMFVAVTGYGSESPAYYARWNGCETYGSLAAGGVEAAPGKLYVNTSSKTIWFGDANGITPIGERLTLGEVAGTAFPGEKGAALASRVGQLEEDVLNLYSDDNVLQAAIDANKTALAAKQEKLSTSADIAISADNKLSLTDTAKLRLFIDKWNNGCGEYGSYDPANAPDGNHPFYLNELWLSYEEALTVDRESSGGNFMDFGVHAMARAKTFYPVRNSASSFYSDASRAFSHARMLLTLRFDPYNYVAVSKYTFSNCIRLYKIFGTLRNVEDTCLNLPALKEFTAEGINKNIILSDAPVVSLASFQYMVDNAANTSAITITVHADVYAKLTGDTSNAAAAALTPEELAQWQALVATASAKNISFATI